MVVAPCLLTLTYTANVFTIKSDYSISIPLIVFVLSLLCQILSHHFLEKRNSAFMDNLFQAACVAPLFVFMELLFVLGYRPALQKRVYEKVKNAIMTWKLRKDRKTSVDPHND